MNDVQFEEELPDQLEMRVVQKSKASFMTLFLIDTGLVKNEQQANIVLIGITIIAFIASIVIVARTLFIKPQPHLETFTLPQKSISNP